MTACSDVEASGVGERDRMVGVMLPHGYAFCVSFFAVVRAGFAAVPLDPKWPELRLREVVRACSMSAVITERRFERVVSSLGVGSVVYVDDTAEPHLLSKNRYRAATARRVERRKHYVYVVFTSGTTGTPKGVPISHANLLPLLHWQQEAFRLGSGTRSVQLLPVTFDFGIEEVLDVLCFGGTLVVPSVRETLLPELYAKALKTGQATMLFTTPTYMRQLLPWADLKPMRLILLGDERLDLFLSDAVVEAASSDTLVFNGYGPTETSITATVHRLTGRERELYPDASSVPIGKPCAGAEVHLVGEDGAELLGAVEGELAIGGPGVSDGYLGGSPSASPSRFVTRTAASGEEKQFYLTGDRVRRLNDGSYEFLDRSDRQMKVRGHRVDLDDITAQLHGNVGIAAVHVDAEFALSGSFFLTAYCVVRGEIPPTESEIAEYARSVMPSYSVPAIRRVEALPTDSNGKLDVRALRRGRSARTASDSGHASDLRSTLLQVLQDVLGRKDLRVDDNIFEHGAHSLNIGSAHRAIVDATGVQFPLIAFYDCYTASKLAARLAVDVEAQTAPPDPSKGGARAALVRLSLLTRFREGVRPG